jgi:hypothetical protein
MHSASNLEDGYFGSGKQLRYSVLKHGRENHTKEILEFLETKESLINRETQLVNIELLDDPLCMNLKPGGSGGFCNVNHMKKCGTAGNTAFSNRMQIDESFRKKYHNISSANMKHAWETGKIKTDNFLGKQHTDKTKKVIGLKNSTSQLGSNNSQYGTQWITNGTVNKKIQKNELIPTGWIKGRNLGH